MINPTYTQSPVFTLSPSVRAFVSRTTTALHQAYSHRRPWPELLDPATLSRPSSFPEAVSRLCKNVSYFRINYLVLLALILAFSLISHPFSLLLLLLLLFSWVFLYLCKLPEPPLTLFGRTLSNNEMLGALVVATVVVVFFTSVGFLLMSTALVGVAILSIHGALRDPGDLFMDGLDQSNTGFFSVVKNIKSSASTTMARREVISLV